MAQNEKVIISVELRDKGVTTGSKKAKDSINGLTDAEKRLNKATKDLEFQQSKEAKQLAELQIKAQLAAKANKELALSTINATKATKQGRAQSGLNNAILVEAGRAASDAQYGMMGMANNIGQLTTLMGQHMRTQGGFIASMKELKGSIMGVGGIMIAIQLFISFLPKIEKWFQSFGGGAKFLSETMKEASQTVESTIGKFETYTRTLKDSSKPQKEQKDAIKALNKEFPEFIKSLKEANLSLEDVSKNTEAATKVEKLYRESIIKTAMAKAAQAKIDKEAAAKLQNEIDLKLKVKELGFDSVEQMEKEIEAFGKLSKGQQKTQVTQRKRLAEGKESIKNFKEENKAIDENIKLLTQYTDIQPPEEEDKDNSSSVFKSKTLNFLNDIQKAREIVASAEIQTEEETLKTKQDLRRQELKADLDLFTQKQKARLEDFLKKKGLTEQEKADAKKTHAEDIKNANNNYQEALAILTKADEAETQLLIRKQGERGLDLDNKRIVFDREIELLRNKINRTKGLIDEAGDGSIKGLIAPKTREDLEEDAAILEERLAFMDIQLAKEIEDEQIRMNLQKQRTQLELELSKKRLNIATLEQQGKDRLLQDYISLINSASAFAKKGTAIQKALAISSTTVSTWSAAQKAYESQLAIKTPGAPIRANIARAAAIAKGLVSVKNIINEKKPDGSTGGGVTQTVQAPDFNIIGSTGVNQLATAIGGTTQEPVKAYVVSSEVTSAQELDRNIIDSASL